MRGAPPALQAEVAAGNAARARLALDHASRLLDTYLRETFKDPTFIQGTAMHSLGWLPRPNRNEVRNMSIRDAYRFFYSALQYYGVALEQMITDQVLYGGAFLDEFRRGEDHMTQILCELQVGAYTLGARPSPDVLRDVMAREYRDVESRSQRNLRDLLILRDYVHLLAIMRDTFRDIHQRTLLATSPVDK